MAQAKKGSASPKAADAMGRSVSLPSLGKRAETKRDIRIQKPGKDNVPAVLRDMDYWKATHLFDLHDTFKEGALDKKKWTKMLCLITRDTETPLSEFQADELFETVDLDSNGNVDKEEFLGWVYRTNSNYCTNMRKRLAAMDSEKVVTFFKRMDTSANGQMDIEEFENMIRHLSPESSLSSKAIKELFKFIDGDQSGEIDVNEFLDWVHPSRKADSYASRFQAKETKFQKVGRRQTMQVGRPHPIETSSPARTTTPSLLGSPGSPGSSSPPSSPTSPLANRADPWGLNKKEMEKKAARADRADKKNALFEMPPKTAVVLEFTIGRDFESTLLTIKKILRKQYTADKVAIVVVYDENVTKCSKLVVQVGRGIVLWDKAAMLPYMDDPFANGPSSVVPWLKKLLEERMPDLLGAAKLEEVQAQRWKAMQC